MRDSIKTVSYFDDQEAHDHFKEVYGYRDGQKLEGDDVLIEMARMDAFIEGLKYAKERRGSE